IYVTHDQTEAMTLGTRIVVMKDGIVQQVDTPTNLYNEPDNLFVAGFIGSPQMNFFDAVVAKEDDKVVLKLGGDTLALPAAKGEALLAGGYEGKTVVAGIRPEDISDEAEDLAKFAGTVIEGEVAVFELLGAGVNLNFDYADTQMTASVAPTTPARVGDTVKFALDPDKIHVFDKTTELAIVH
ncbi:MAG: TOBE domain-containing protein, partial [Acutalibacteraceae bacterium]|nr:TOBE domain-containing protein [Acutalibacteraceae bacterium]